MMNNCDACAFIESMKVNALSRVSYMCSWEEYVSGESRVWVKVVNDLPRVKYSVPFPSSFDTIYFQKLKPFPVTWLVPFSSKVDFLCKEALD